MRVRFTPVLLIAMLAVVANCSMRTAHALIDLNLNSRQFDGSTENLGQMLLDDQGPYNLPHNTRVPSGTHKIRFIPPAGFYMVAWEVDGQLMPPGVFTCEIAGGSATPDPTITAIYQKNGLPAYVGGVILPTNTYAVLVPYLAVIGLVATAAIAVKKRRH